MVDQHRSRAAVPPTTAPDVGGGGLYEAAFSTTSAQPQCGVTLARTVEEARNRLADLLLLCDPAARAVADITEITTAQVVARYGGTAGEVFAQLTAASATGDDAARLSAEGNTR